MAGIKGPKFEVTEERGLIQRRRLQILIHSWLYYKMDISLVSDQTFDSWANELVDLQAKFPLIAERVMYHKEFKTFDGSTGYDLPYSNPEIERKGLQLLAQHDILNSSQKRLKTKRKKEKKDGKESKMVRRRNKY